MKISAGFIGIVNNVNPKILIIPVPSNSLMKLIYFYEKKPGPCVLQNGIISNIENDFDEKLEVEKINSEENESSVKKYNIREIPTVIIEHEGKEIARFSGLAQELFIRRAIARNST